MKVVSASSAQPSTGSNFWNWYWWKPSVHLSSLKNNSICQRSEYNSITLRTDSRRSFVIRIFTSSGVAVEDLLGCRKDETDLADRVHPSFLMGVIRPGFRFRPDPMRRQTPNTRRMSLAPEPA